jgi:PAS domain S-box-containing protein
METKKKETTKEKYPGASHSTSSLQDTAEKKPVRSPSVLPVMKGQTDVERIHDLQNIVGAGEVAYDVTKPVLVEEKLRETKEYLDNLINNASSLVIVWDPQFRITLFNRAFEHLTGRDAKETLGQRFDILLPDTYAPLAMDLVRKTLDGGRWESVEIPILDKNGEIRTVLWNSATIFGADGKTIVSTIAQGLDITDRKKTESEFRLRALEYEKMNMVLEEEIRQRKISDTMLKNTLSLLNASLESTADGIFVVDQQDKITSYNQNFVTMWNIPTILLESGENERVINYLLPQLRNAEGFLTSNKELKAHPEDESSDIIEFIDGKIFERYSKSQKIGESVVGRVWSFRDVTDRKLAEEAKIASEIRYRRLFETAQDGILILDADTGQIVEVNPFLIEMLGFSRDQFLGKKIWEIGLFKDIVANKDNFEELQRKEYIRYEDMPLETADGRRIAVEFLSNVYTVKNKKVIQCNIRNNTERKRAEEAQVASEIRYRRLFETAQDGILILDADTGQIVEVNPFLIEMLGFSRDQFLGKKIWEIGLFKDIVANKDNFEELQRKEYIRYEDMPLETADGRRIAVEFLSNVYTVKNKKVIQCNIRNNTERKRAEEAQVASEIRYRRLFETAQDGILILDADTGQIVEVNPFLIEMLGFSRDQFLGKKIWEIGLFKDIVANKDNFEELQRKEYVRYEDMPLETADGQRIAVEFLSNVYTVNNKKVIQCNIRNITVRKKLEEDLVVKAAELARSNIELQQFAYIASHDLQEPLRAISGFTELLVKRYHGKIDEKADTYIDFITEGTTRMQQMIQDLLVYSRVQTQVHEFVRIDSNTSLDLALSDLQVATKEHNAIITNDPLPSIFADQEQITKMFQNLIGNAIKFHKPGVAPNVHISAKQDVNYWIFSVSDNGIGINQQYADRIFKIFQRLHTRDEYPGTGIGLAICKRIAEQHGGTIWIESVPGSGSTFYFTIPKRKKETNHE